jgi:hypothetical protein
LPIKWHKNVTETVLIDRFSFKTALLRESAKNGSCKKNRKGAFWEDRYHATALGRNRYFGSKTFIEKMKEALGYKAKGRKIISADDTFELREVITP